MLSEDQDDLLCPISRELLEDPIVVPCCGRAFSRKSLSSYFTIANKTCPCCRGNLDVFNVELAPKNVNLASLVDLVSNTNVQPSEEQDKSLFRIEAEHLIDMDDRDIGVAELTIHVNDPSLNPKPTLFIALADVSGSMQGKSWQQVCTSLKHIAHQSFGNPSVICRLVAYESSAKEIDTKGDLKSIIKNIEQAFTGGGTDFASAFQLACSIITRESGKDREDLPFGSVVIAFLTDGEDFSKVGKPGGLQYLSEEINRVYRGDITIHTVGFGSHHNLTLLDNIRKVGSIEGAYRYADTNDNDDIICGKLTSIFDSVSSSSTVTADIVLPEGMKMLSSNDSNGGSSNTYHISVPVNSSGKGFITRYVSCEPESEKNLKTELRLASKEPLILEIKQTRCPQKLRLKCLQRLASHHVDQLAAQALQLSNMDRKQYGEELFVFHCELLLKCCKSITGVESYLSDKITVIEAEITKLKNGEGVNKNVLNDLKFSSMFAPKKEVEKIQEKKTRTITIQPPKFKSLSSGGSGGSSKYNIQKIHYVHGKKEYTELHTAVVQMKNGAMDGYIQQHLPLLDCVDRDGNTALHLSCMKGNLFAVKLLVQLGASLDVTNSSGFSPLDLAILFGFDRMVEFLLDSGAKIASQNDYLLTYIFDRHFFRTASILLERKVCSITHNVRNFVDGTCYQWIEDRETCAASEELLELAIKKSNNELFEKCINAGFKPSAYHLYLSMDYGSLQIFKALAKTVDVNSIAEYEGAFESLLFVASASGKMDYVKVLLERGADKEWRNIKGNTPLWIACCNTRMDVVEALLEAGCDPNTCNDDRVVPLISCAQRGSVEIAEILMSYGAEVNIQNKNGDNPLIIACRTGQAEILELFLSKATEEDLQYCAKIDGFNAVFSAAEQDRAECIHILHRFGASVKCRTRPDNQIIQYATPLHLTALYNCAAAAKVLLDLGAEIDAEDLAGMTPLHVAMLRGNFEVIKVLISRKANMFALDNAGNMPGAYCQDINPDLLVDPLYPYLVKIARGEYGLLESQYIDMLRKYSSLAGYLQPRDIVNVRGLVAGCALIEAVVYNNLNAAKVLVELGADASIQDQYGMNARDWAEVIGGMMKSNIPGTPNADLMNRLNSVVGKDKQLVTMVGRPPSAGNVNVNLPSINDLEQPQLEETIIEPLKLADHPKWVGGKNVFLKEMFDVKRNIIGKLASGSTISPRTWAILYLIAGETSARQIYNEHPQSIDVTLVPKFDGECFIVEQKVDKKVDRNKFMPGSVVCWNKFQVAGLNWSIPKQGTIFLIKSKSGVRVGQHIVFNTKVQFKVTNWYKADATCIAQKNIRESCFKLDDIEKYRPTDSPIIIELEEQ